MRKPSIKVLAMAAAVVLTVGIYGCPTPGTDVSGSSDLTMNDAAPLLEDYMQERGYDATVTVRDYDGNGFNDFVFSFQSAPDDDVNQLAEFLVDITASVGLVYGEIGEQADQAVALFGSQVYMANSKALNKCYNLIIADKADAAVDCVLDTWRKYN